MAKPIFIANLAFQGHDPKICTNIADDLTKKLDDYHVLVTFDGSLNESKFQMFSDKEIEPIELEKLKEIVNPKPEITMKVWWKNVSEDDLKPGDVIRDVWDTDCYYEGTYEGFRMYTVNKILWNGLEETDSPHIGKIIPLSYSSIDKLTVSTENAG